MSIHNSINHKYDIDIEIGSGIDNRESASFNACEVALESASETRCDDGGIDTFGTFGSAGTLGGTAGSLGTAGCCC